LTQRSNFYKWWPFVLLLAAGASRWMVAAAHPEAEPTLVSEALGCTWAAIVSLAFLPFGRNVHPIRSGFRVEVFRTGLAGGAIFAGPAIALLLGGKSLDAGSVTIALALSPVVVAVGTSARRADSSTGVAGHIWPSLAAVAGLLLVLVQPNLSNARTDAALVLAPLLAGGGAVLFGADREESPWGVTTALAGAGLLFGFATLMKYVLGMRPAVSFLAVGCDGLLAFLGMLTLQRIGSVRWSSQFTWLPLLIVVEGLALVHPGINARLAIGVGLLALASVYLLLPPSEDAESVVPKIAR
jgi:hypothetical protein